MAGTKQTPYCNGEATLTSFINYMNLGMRGYYRLAVSVDYLGDFLYVTIYTGAILEIDGDLFSFSSEESNFDEADEYTDGTYYFYVDTDGLVHGTDSAPTWSDSKQGWYDGTNRYITEVHVASSALIKGYAMDSIYYNKAI
ncbi:MAG: hypothetical protein PHE51_04965 [Eubacteriales bacterium]|nr:hypothetical protein [Eubacteriales bacterium]